MSLHYLLPVIFSFLSVTLSAQSLPGNKDKVLFVTDSFHSPLRDVKVIVEYDSLIQQTFITDSCGYVTLPGMGMKDVLYISHPMLQAPVIYCHEEIVAADTLYITVESSSRKQTLSVIRGEPSCIGFIRDPDRFDIANPSTQQVYPSEMIRRFPRR